MYGVCGINDGVTIVGVGSSVGYDVVGFGVDISGIGIDVVVVVVVV